MGGGGVGRTGAGEGVGAVPEEYSHLWLWPLERTMGLEHTRRQSHGEYATLIFY